MAKLQKLENQNVDIRPLEQKDIDVLVKNFTFPEIGTEKTVNQWNTYYKEHAAGERFVCLITKNDRIVGYGSLLPNSTYKPFEENDVFEIRDLFIMPTEREQGLATLLITYFESITSDEDVSYLGVGIGLSADCAPAQQLFVHLGYAPYSEGMTYKGIPVMRGNSYPVDNNLRLWFVKDVSNK